MRSTITILGRAAAAALAAALAAAAGCSTGKAPPLMPIELSEKDVNAFLDSGVDPRYMGITVVRGPAGPEFEFGNRPWPGKAARTPFWKDAGGLPAVTAETAARVKFHALLDTSARQSWLVFASRRALDYRVFKDSSGNPVGEWPDHVKRQIPGYAGVANKAVLENLHVESPVFYVPPGGGMLGALARPERAEGGQPAAWRRDVHAVFGTALLKKFSFVTLDFPRREITWASTKEYKGGPGLEAVPMGDWKGRPTVDVRLGGVDEPAVVDTAGDYDVSLPAASLAGVPGAADGPVDMELVIGGTVVVPRVTVVTHESLGLPPDWPARIGWRVWREHCMTLDWKHRRLWLGKPASADDAGGGGKEKAAPAGPVRYRGISP